MSRAVYTRPRNARPYRPAPDASDLYGASGEAFACDAEARREVARDFAPDDRETRHRWAVVLAVLGPAIVGAASGLLYMQTHAL